jgi:transposase
MTYPLSLAQRWQIVALLKHSSLNQQQIAQRFHCHRETIANIAKLYNSTNSVSPRHRSGRPKKLNPGKRNSLRIALRNNPTATIPELKTFLQKHHHITVSPSTIKRTRRALHFHPVSEIVQPKLTKKHKKQRLDFAKSNLNTNWKLVLFSDEKLFSLNATRNRVWIEEGAPIPVREVQESNYSVMVWGAIWYQGRSTLSLTTGSINSKRYCEILGEHLLPSYPGQQFKLLQDNAPSHNAKNTMNWINEHAVTLLPQYPPYSPDCNPIELIWNQMSHAVNSMSPSSPKQLHDAIEHAWRDISQSTIQSTIDRLPSVLETIIERDGDR